MVDGDVYVRCRHRIELVDNGDWQWFECTKCGYEVPEEEEHLYVKKGKKR